MTLRQLLVASEIYPLAKTGGLADVCGALPKAIARLGIDVRLMMPAYPEALARLVAPRHIADLACLLPGVSVRVVEGSMPDSGLRIWLVDCPELFDRPGTPYQDPNGCEWEDNALRFGVLCHAAAWVALGRAIPGWRADVVHAHDWHAGLVPLLLQLLSDHSRPRTVFTVHNAAFQGNFPLDQASQLGLPKELLIPDGIEFYGRFSFLKAGVRYADKVTTVSPTYAKEICTPEFGFGMEGVFQARCTNLVGILNGIDAERWDPGTDPYLSHNYSGNDLTGKQGCKADTQKRLRLNVDASAPLAVFISRLTQQKMADVLLDRLPGMMTRHPRLQFALHGRGEPALEAGFSNMVARYPGRMSVQVGYDEARAHCLHAAGDILLHGSRFEPCGLAQMYAMRYGTVPVVRRVGGLADSVRDPGMHDRLGRGQTGFIFDDATGDAMGSALSRCVATYETQPRRWSELRKLDMACDFGWARSAAAYACIYGELAGKQISSLVAERGAPQSANAPSHKQGRNAGL
ncbi:MAG: glycogen synthase GlgA [Cupriavidus sp.]|nr:glycogen synthase GlgA [Cupriavidus sp.]